MSSPSTARLYSTTKTYGRARDNHAAASRSFDEMMSGKAAPGKASAAYTKWGNTNYVANRDRKKAHTDPASHLSREVRMQSEDPFSFDTDERGKTSPTKVQPSPSFTASASYQRIATRLPASRIFTPGNVDPESESSASTRTSFQHSSDSGTSSTSNLCAIARPGRTYTRSHEGRVGSSPTKQRFMTQYNDVGKTVKKDFGVLYSVESHKPVSSQMSPKYVSPALNPYISPQKRTAEASLFSPTVFDTEDDNEIFPVYNHKPLVGRFTRDYHSPISSVSYECPVKKMRKDPSVLHGHTAAAYSGSGVWGDYRSQFRDTNVHTDPAASMFMRGVPSSQETKGDQDTRSIPSYKLKFESFEKKDSMQSKCFKNMKDSVGDAWPEAFSASSSSGTVSGSSSSHFMKTPTYSQGTSSTVSTPKQSLMIDISDDEEEEEEDENMSSFARTTGSRSVLSPKNHPAGDATKFVSKKPVQSSQSSTRSITSVQSKSASNTSTTPSVNSKTTSNCSKTFGSYSKTSGSYSKTTSSGSSTTTSSSSKNESVGSGNRRILSGVKHYRIFKSRRAAQSPPKETEVAEDTTVSVNSPPMPELDLELPRSFGKEENYEDRQHPPDIIDVEEIDIDAAAESSQVPQEDGQTLNNSQLFQQTTDDELDDLLVDSPSFQMKPLDSQDTPSPASVDSQELSQDMLSSADINQKEEEDVPAAPRRFFKSRKSSGALGLQRRMLKKSQSKASYNARSWHQDENENNKDKEVASVSPPVRQAKGIPFSDEEETSPVSVKEPRLIRAVHWPQNRGQEAYTSVKVKKEHRELYMVVKNVKMAHEVQESGETQDFIDDVEYLLDNLKDDQPVSIRSLSTIQLAGKCILPAFRMHLRAHGTVTKIFSLLHDACLYPSLALSTAAMMFMLSQDRLTMDLDKDSLHLMLKLNEVDMPRSNREDIVLEEDVAGSTEDSMELEKCRRRVQELLLQLQRESNAAKQIDLNFISTGNLAMESLLSLTSRRAGEWFKEELRALGGLDHFVETVNHCVLSMNEDLAYNLERYTHGLKKLNRCLRVLENITFMNSDNQTYIISYRSGLLISATGRILQQCVESLPITPLYEMESEVALKEQTGWIVFECLLAVLRVLLNITHDCELGCTRVGEEQDLLQTVLQCVINIQWCVPPDYRFDVLVLSLGLLINLMEHCPQNRQCLMESRLAAQIREDDYPADMDAVEALVQLFLQRESAATQMEETPETPVKANHDLNRSGEWHESESGIEWIARSAEKVKAAEKQQKESSGEGTSRMGEKEEAATGDKAGDGASNQEDEENFTKALHKAGKHMENSIVASYVGLLLGCLIQDNEDYVEIVREHLPEGSFDSMIKILKKFLGFMNLTTAIGTTDANSIQRVIDTLEAC